MNQYENIEEEEITHRFSIKVCDLGSLPLYIHYSFALVFLLPFLPTPEIEMLSLPLLLPFFLFLAVITHGAAKYFYLRTQRLDLHSAVIYPFGTYFVSKNEKIVLPTNFLGIACCLVIPISYFFLFPANTSLLDSLLKDLSYSFLFAAGANLIPTFPSDSAFFLNSFLVKLRVKNPFRASSLTGQFISCFILLASIYFKCPTLSLFAVLTLMSSISRYVHSQLELASDKYKLADLIAPLSELTCFQHGITLKAAVKAAKGSKQSAFPVVHGDEIIGIIHKEPLTQLSENSKEDIYISELMERDFPKVPINTSIVDAAKFLKPFSFNAIVVFDNEKIAGIVFEERIAELMSNPN